jgi:tRNA threonylcarbamoyladenosine biosynthesis protein TsaB
MADAGADFADLDLIAVTVGPGAFTGIRIGLAAARAMALSAALPIVGVTTLEAVAHAQDALAGPLLVALDTKREDVYVQLFDAERTALSEPRAAMPGDVGALLPEGPLAIAGDAAETVIAALGAKSGGLSRLQGPDIPDAAVVAEIAASRGEVSALKQELSPPAPLYLRPPDATPPAAASPAAASPAAAPPAAAPGER